jgi:polyhydroxyalkanoate synthesis regulator phasin
MTTDKIKVTIDDLVEKGKISDTEGKKIIEDFLSTTEEKRTDFENKLKKTKGKISNTFDFNKKEKEMDLLKERIKGLEKEIEDILVKSFKVDEVRQMLKEKKITNGLTLIALQWFFLEYYKG